MSATKGETNGIKLLMGFLPDSHQVEQADGRLFHLSREMFNLREDIAIKELQHQGNDDTEDGGNKRHQLHECQQQRESQQQRRGQLEWSAGLIPSRSPLARSGVREPGH